MFHLVTRTLFFLVLLWIPKVLSLNVLVSKPNVPNWNIEASQYLNASNFYLVMQPDCNLVIYNGSTPFLLANLTQLVRDDGTVGPVGPSDTRKCYASMQTDANFVVYQTPNATSRIPLWQSGTWVLSYTNSSHRYLILGHDGRLQAYEADGSEVTVTGQFIPVNASTIATFNVSYPFAPELEWKPSVTLGGYPFMPAEYYLSQGSRLQTLNERFVLTLGQDCKLQSQEIWEQNDTVKSVIWDPQRSMPVSGNNCTLRLQRDGLLEVRNNVSGVVHWNSNVSGNDSVNWVLKVNADDGHVTVSDILDPSNILWRSSIDATPESGTVGVWPIVVGVIGGVLVMAMAGFGLWWFYIQPRVVDKSGDLAFQRRLQRIGKKSRVLSAGEIKKATNNFGSRIGSGGFGDVFYGRLADGEEIAAKVFAAGSHQSEEEFYNEIELLSVVHHKYLVSLLGYSFSRKCQVLIYEYMGGGDLRHRLQGAGAARSPLSWRQRTSIAVQVAEGLEYLHDKCSPSIIHRDVKSNNILLTTSLYVAKVADFGLSKLRRKDQEDTTHVTTVVKGTPGYLDPEYHETGMLTEKSDVYAFGIVLMEILTGQNQMSISQTVSEARRLEQYEGLADPNLGGRYDRDEFVSLVELSLWCVRKSNVRRPCMREVVSKMREIGMTSLESVAPEPVMTFGESFENSDEDLEVLSFNGFPSSSSVKDGTSSDRDGLSII